MNPAIAGAEKINRNALNSEQERSHLDALDHVLGYSGKERQRTGCRNNVGSDDIWKQQVWNK